MSGRARQRRLTHAARKSANARKQASKFKDGNGKFRVRFPKPKVEGELQ